jgi:hypothetical protein
MTASGSMVTNYAYGQKMLVDSVIKAKGDKLSLENLYMGIDCVRDPSLLH